MKVRIDVNQVASAELTFEDHQYVLRYMSHVSIEISRSLPVRDEAYLFHTFPAQLEALLPRQWHRKNLDCGNDKLALLVKTGRCVPGHLSFFEL